MKKTFKKVLNTIVDIIIVLILIVSILVVMLSLTSKSQGVSHLFGIAPLTVQSDSMEDTFYEDDLIFGKVTNDGDYEYQVGDVVTFPIKIGATQTYNTHRIVEVIEDENISYYRTQGDNESKPDEELQTSSTIVAKWTGKKISGVGKVIDFIRTQLGFFLCVLLPMIIFFVYEAIRVIMNIVAYNKEKALEEAQAAVQNAELTEEQKKKAIEEYLASIGQKPNEGNEDCVQTPAQDNTSQAEE
ncbi:MAG: signal peptidase I [Clostridia bacterium]|nr:signal peptidase I [Clostridia bacterium]